MRDKVIRFLESFLCAGTSALLIVAAHLYPALWWLSLVALAPFLWRAVKVRLSESIILGGLLASAYCFVAFPIGSWATAGAPVFKLLELVILLALYSFAVNRIGKRIGFNAIFISALWLPLEYALSCYAGFGSIFTFSITDSSLGYRIASLFGLLMLSFMVVLVNSLVLMILKHAVQVLLSKSPLIIKADKKTYPPFREILLPTRWFSFPDMRAPPVASSITRSVDAAQFAVRWVAS
jgi:apolipoprotein N-acyltransferase